MIMTSIGTNCYCVVVFSVNLFLNFWDCTASRLISVIDCMLPGYNRIYLHSSAIEYIIDLLVMPV